MALNKCAQIRYQTLDKCFSNKMRKFFIEDLIEACNNSLYEYTDGVTVSKRQIYDDIKFMKSEAGWEIQLEKKYEGHKSYYRYSDPNFSINKQILNPEETGKLEETIFLISRFQGLPTFDWVHDFIKQFKSSLNNDIFSEESKEIISIDNNSKLSGLEWLSICFHAIVNKTVLEIEYKSFNNPSLKVHIHPYFLKQYNNRWYLWGYCQENTLCVDIPSIALDRILEIKKETEIKFIPNTKRNFKTHFNNIIGVTNIIENPVRKIILRVENSLYNYINTKPIHPSQRIIKKNSDSVEIELTLKDNYELQTLLLTYADRLEIISPIDLKESVLKRARAIINNNS